MILVFQTWTSDSSVADGFDLCSHMHLWKLFNSADRKLAKGLEFMKEIVFTRSKSLFFVCQIQNSSVSAGQYMYHNHHKKRFYETKHNHSK